MPRLRESDLYPPIKAFLQSQGYSVKSEISNCDVVAVRGGDEPVIVELKTTFTLPLLFQGVRRQSMIDHVYLAFALPMGRPEATLWRRHHRDIAKLCRMLGLGLITVRIGGEGRSGVEVRLDPGPYRPRRNKHRRAMLLRGFQRRVGDPNQAGTSKRPIVTAYR